MSLYAQGEMTEGQWAVAQDFCRLIGVMQSRLSAGLAKLEEVGIAVDQKQFDRAFWQLVDVETPVRAAMLDHIGASVAKHYAQARAGA